MKKTFNRESLEEFYTAAVEANKLSNEININTAYEKFQAVATGDLFFNDRELVLEAMSMLPNGFLDKIAAVIVNSLNTNPFMWLAVDKELYYLFEERQTKYLNQKVLELGYGTDAGLYYQGMDYIENDSWDMALFYLNKVEYSDPLLHLLIGTCYDGEENFPAAMREYQMFLKSTSEYLDRLDNQDMRDAFMEVATNVIEVQLRLVSIYNHLKYFEEAKELSEIILKEWTLENLAESFHDNVNTQNWTTYEVFCVDVALLKDKLDHPAAAAIFLENALNFAFKSDVLTNQLIFFKERGARQLTANEIMTKIIPLKRPFDIPSFTASNSLAREKNLEDLIIEHIKYGFTTFGKDLELFQSDQFYGRQFILKDGSRLDLLLIEKSTDTLYVVELKRNRAGIEVYHQVSHYVNSIQDMTDKMVKGIICLHEPSQELIEIVKTDKNIELFTYHFEFKRLG